MHKLTVVIVNYNVRFYLEQCLYSLRKSMAGIDASVVVVDNHSSDGSVGYLRELFPEVEFVASPHNLGFARANNVAIRRTKGEYVLLLNPDTVVAEDTVRKAVAFLDEYPDVGSLGVRMLRSDGTSAPESRRGLPTPVTSFWKMLGLTRLFPRSRRFARYYLGHLPWDEPSQIEVVSGAFCMIRRSALDEVGLLDEDFFMYGEDIDLSYRILASGRKNWYLPLDILHYKGESTQKSSFRYVHVFYGAMIIFLRKHYGGLGMMLSIPIYLGVYLKALVAMVTMLPHKIQKYLALPRSKKHYPHYRFVGSADAAERCKALLQDKAVDIRFLEGCDNHLQMEDPKNKSGVVVVYDTSEYSYAEIFSHFSSMPRKNVMMGFYYPERNIVVAPSDVFENF